MGEGNLASLHRLDLRKPQLNARKVCQAVVTAWLPFGKSPLFSFRPRDLKVSNLLMTDKGCVKTGGCRVLSLCMWRWGCQCGSGNRDDLSVFLAPGHLSPVPFPDSSSFVLTE